MDDKGIPGTTLDDLAMEKLKQAKAKIAAMTGLGGFCVGVVVGWLVKAFLF
jgi:hypothetical protein